MIKTQIQINSITQRRNRTRDLGNAAVVATVLTLSLFFAISIFSVGFIQSQEKQKTQWNAQQSELEQFAEVIAHDVSVYDLNAVARAARIISAQPAIIWMSVTGKYNDIIHQSGPADLLGDPKDLVDLNVPLSFEGSKVGEVQFKILRSAVESGHNSPLSTAAWAFVFSSIFGALIIYIYINRFVSAPLKELQEACDRTAETGEHHSTKFVMSNRFGAYAKSFNKMQTKLSSLQYQKENLLEILTEEQNAIDAFLSSSNNAIFVFDSEGQMSLKRGSLPVPLCVKFLDSNGEVFKFNACIEALKKWGKPVLEDDRILGYILEDESENGFQNNTTFLMNVHELPSRHWAIFAYDISSLRRAERTVAQLQKSRALEELTGGVAHDFNNILASISANVESFAIETAIQLDEEQRSMIDHCIKASEMGADLCQQLLAYSRQKVLEETSIDTGRAVKDIAKFLVRTVGINYKVTTNIIQSAPIFADHSMLQRSLTNLSLNARNAMPNGGEIKFTVNTDTANENVIITVFNNGPHIETNIINRVFDPFFSTSQSKGGNGLGLSVVKGFVEQSGGLIVIRNVADGVEVEMSFPIGNQQPKSQPERQNSAPMDAHSTPREILLIDDNELVLRGFSRLLKRQGHRVSTAKTYAEIAEQLQSLDIFDVVITDVMMPEIDGVTIANQIRERGSNVPVIFMTGLESYRLRRQVKDLKNAYLLPKPASLSDLNKHFETIFSSELISVENH